MASPGSNVGGSRILLRKLREIMEAGGEAIQRKFGWVGCVTVIALIIGGIALLFWLIQ